MCDDSRRDDTLREGLEAFLIVGILLGHLRKIGQSRYAKYVWSGTAGAILLSVLMAYIFQVLSVQFEGTAADGC